MRDALPAFREHLAARYRSPRTRATYLAHVEAFIQSRSTTNDGCVRAREIEAYLARPRQDGSRRAASSRNQTLSALRAFSAFAEREFGWSENPTKGIPFVREPPHDPPVLWAEEMRRLFMAAATSTRPRERARDLVILSLLSLTALRVHELVALNVDQLDRASSTLLSVRGKGDTVHDLALPTSALELIRAWLDEREALVDEHERALFISHTGRRLSVRAVQQLFVRLRVAMGTSKRITPHTMRHSAATLSLLMGTDLLVVSSLLRHSDLNSTRRYTRLIDTQRREAVQRLASIVPAELLGGTQPGTSPRSIAPLRDAGVLPSTQTPAIPATILPCAHHDMGAVSTPRTPPKRPRKTPQKICGVFVPDADVIQHAAPRHDVVEQPSRSQRTMPFLDNIQALLKRVLPFTFAIVAFAACASPPVTADGGDGASIDATTVDTGTADSASGCIPGCNDAIDCTDDTCMNGVCVHTPVPARCAAGASCDLRMGCRMGRPCAGASDCADMDPCTTNERCDGASRTCLFDSLDGDRDGIPPRVCGGGDCDDSNANVRPGTRETCNGVDDNCNGTVDELPAPEGHENCFRRACVAGRCTDTCLTGYASCGSASSPYCADLQADSAHCGACGNACPSGGRCSAGRCDCASGSTLCSASGAPYCARLDSDPANCGACGSLCDETIGMMCTMGRCACRPGSSLCGGRCVNLSTDRNNCGTCGTMCSATQYCAAGACVPLVCAHGEIACNGECFDPLGSWEHCGGCGGMCPAGRPRETYTFCDEGACRTSLVGQTARCASGRYPCEGARGIECVNVQTNSHHCGGCEVRCSPGQVCTAGRCVAAPVGCAAGQMLCSGACLDTQSNVENCGGCGVRCNCCGSTTGTCVAGTCQYSSCPTAPVMCGGSMTCTFSDPRNCGACGRACMPGQTCGRGTCL